MKQYFYKAAIIPVYINMMETAKKKAARAKLPISDDMLVDIAAKAILASDRFPRTTDAWEENNYVDKTWSEWKETYLSDHEYRNNCLLAAGDASGNNFGTANAATTRPSDRQVAFQDRPPTIPDDTLYRLDLYLTNMSDAFSNPYTARSLDAADISSTAKSLETLTLSNAALVKKVASL